MKFFKSQINNKDIKTLEEDITFKNVRKPLLDLKNVHVKATLFNENNIINVSLEIKATAIVECAYTLEPTPYPLSFTDSIDISEDENNIDTYCIKENLVNLDPIILDLIIGEIPIRVIKKGAKLKKSGEGYRVLSEDELNKEKEEVTSSPFDKLKDLDL